MLRDSCLFVYIMTATKVVVLGHSFVRRLGLYLGRDDERCNFGLDESLFDISIIGFGGLTMRNSRLHSVKPLLENCDLVILDIGSNDLCDQTLNAQRFVNDLLSYAQFLRIGLNVHKVVILQLLHRSVVPYFDYNSVVTGVNVSLQECLAAATLPKIYFWKHRAGLWQSIASVLDRQGVHL